MQGVGKHLQAHRAWSRCEWKVLSRLALSASQQKQEEQQQVQDEADEPASEMGLRTTACRHFRFESFLINFRSFSLENGPVTVQIFSACGAPKEGVELAPLAQRDPPPV